MSSKEKEEKDEKEKRKKREKKKKENPISFSEIGNLPSPCSRG
jgi:hypothetical protein